MFEGAENIFILRTYANGFDAQPLSVRGTLAVARAQQDEAPLAAEVAPVSQGSSTRQWHFTIDRHGQWRAVGIGCDEMDEKSGLEKDFANNIETFTFVL